MSTLFLPALLLLSGVLCGASTVDPVPTYEHQDRSTGKILQCNKCPPGTHMVAHCTATSPTRCSPCGPDRFTEQWNYLPMCLYCSNLCSENQEVEKECSPTSDRVCRCKEGFYASDDFCFPHSECGPGQGVLTKGTLQNDTVCEHCPDGYFSNSSSTSDLCVKHLECSSTQLVLLHGSAYHDTVCGSWEDLANGGDTLRTFLSAFFSSHRMRVGRMKRFIHKYIQKSGEDRRATLPKKRGPLLDIIREWLVQAPEEELRKLPAKLMLLHGSVYHDTVCGSCEDLANGGDTLRTFLSRFFSSHRMHVGRMKRFIHKYIQKSGEDRWATLPKKRGPLLDIIREWLVQAPEEELRKLPAKLKACDLRVMAEKLEKRLTKINCTLSI
ncbi:tumor necrosis factor receptor superfamily member 11B-like isoform X2 [Mugil cephalus]|uniref:tumor necrosis factor receptor superfamily member 11B-like isoform X2 n=1 Tax=Mugil cephalus TaxID=48193 RepID=UPI001FB5B048|nr:tumor necrosis factor receptor superfamily member 11B-like isoform X2 [Mugil cephalus]